MKRGFALGVLTAALTALLVGCTTKTITVPANADASCSVVSPKGGGTTR